MSLDFRNPDYAAINVERYKRLQKLRADPHLLAAAKVYYRDHIAQFINDWGVTVDPRVAAAGRPPMMPFVLFPKQFEFVEWVVERWRAGEPGLCVKSRDVGASWLAMSVAASLCMFHKNMMVGVGSALEIKIDRTGDPDTLFYKARMFVKHIPPEFRGEWDITKHSPYLRLLFPETGSSITGEAGDSIGRGGRKALFFIDEAAHLERPKLIDAALAATTDCRIDMSSVNGTANVFFEKATSGRIKRFDFGWRDDPRKDDDWYAQKCIDLDPVIVAQEIDCNFSASIEGVVIPSSWVQAAIGLHEKLDLQPRGNRVTALDVADRGVDKNAFAVRHGILLEHVESWTGKDSDIFGTTAKAFRLCDERKLTSLEYDADGLGAGVRGDARVLNDGRLRKIRVNEFRGSSSPLFPEQLVPRTDRKNKDFYANRKAQGWWHLRFLFQEAFKAAHGMPFDAENVICIAKDIPELTRLASELSQATVKETVSGKLQIDKIPDGATSPNLADAVMMCYAPRRVALAISDEALKNAQRA